MDYNSYCALTFKGILLDQIVPGYMTVNVEGRGLSSKKTGQIEIPGRDGSIVNSYSLPPKEIVVHYQLKANNNAEFLSRLEILNHYLNTSGDVAFKFGDEDYIRYGRLSHVQNPPYDSYKGFGSFTLLCADPYKYSPTTFILAGGDSIPSDLLVSAFAEKIIVTLAENANQVVVKNPNTGQRIIFNDDFSVGDILVIDYTKGFISAEKNNRNILAKLALESDIENFRLNRADNVLVTPSTATLRIEYRKRAL